MSYSKKRILGIFEGIYSDECATINLSLIDPDDIYNFNATIVGPEGRKLYYF